MSDPNNTMNANLTRAIRHQESQLPCHPLSITYQHLIPQTDGWNVNYSNRLSLTAPPMQPVNSHPNSTTYQSNLTWILRYAHCDTPTLRPEDQSCTAPHHCAHTTTCRYTDMKRVWRYFFARSGDCQVGWREGGEGREETAGEKSVEWKIDKDRQEG